MQKKIEELLARQSPLKARKIAKEIGEDRTEVNRFLYGNLDRYFQDEKSGWSLLSTEEICVTFSDSKWVTGQAFEASLKSAGCVMSSECAGVRFVVPKGHSLMLEASARLLALCNQLTDCGKLVAIDFEGNQKTLSYLNRSGFLQHLDGRVRILPRRPRAPTSVKFRNNSRNLLEVRAIESMEINRETIKGLNDKFVDHAGQTYSDMSFTIFAELLQNVCDHSQTRLPGFAALQSYKGSRPHLQAIVSDSGVGIIEKIGPVLKQNYPELEHEFNLADASSQLDLIARIFEQGGISSRDNGVGGAGLSRVRALGESFNAVISIRQETSELILSYREGRSTTPRKITGLPRILGTHVCFDLIVD